ncbi:MAG: tetratricopeptide repeat protein, partial [Verrucomicrobiota bacterium]
IFQRAGCELALKQAAPAETDFQRARDLDTLRFRSDSRINEIIRQVAAAKNVSLTDADQQFIHEPEAIPGDDLFYDHVHLNFTGNYRLAVLFADELEQQWPGAPAPASPWLTEDEVAHRLAFTDFDQRRVDAVMRARLQQPPFDVQSNFRARDEHLREAISALSAPPANFSTNYQAAIALAPDDWLLHADFAQLLEAAGNNSSAAEQWLAVTRLLPHSPEAWDNLGRLARLAGDLERAGDYLQEALKQQPDSVESLTEAGILETSRGNASDARRHFQAALRLRPGFSPARINLGLLLAREGDPAGAITQYREELRWHTNNVDARINLANLLNAQHQTGEAVDLYEQAIRLQPENPIARYNLGRLLVADNRPAEAVTNFIVALRQRPDVAEIHFEFGNALARLGNDTDALAQFAEAVRLKPDLVDARFNYGVALARSGRYADAATEFRETLRLRPQHPLAQHMLDEVLRTAQPVRVPAKN